MPVKNNQKPDRAKNKKAGNAPKETPEQKRNKLAKELGLTIRQKNFVDELIGNKGISATEAYIRAYGSEDRTIAANSASRLLGNASIQIYKDSAVSKAKSRIVSLVSSDNEQIALKASQDILDRTQGKAQQKDSTVSRVVRVEVDLTGVKLGNHYLPKAVIDDIV